MTFVLCFFYAKSQDLYFPPTSSQNWETQSLADLGWNESALDDLLDFLGENGTRAFIVLKNGRIAVEHYFGDFEVDDFWYWASAGKTITAFMVGMAIEEGSIELDDSVSDYLGLGWTSATPEQETQITLRHLLSMTSGLDDGVPNSDCTDPECLLFLAEPGTRWAYHNAPYTLIQRVIAAATGQNFNLYTIQRLRNRIGMSGAFVPTGFNQVYFSDARSMARFGLLMLAGGEWEGIGAFIPKDYFEAMLRPSSTHNEAYGYLWWLNGSQQFRLPATQFLFQGMIAPNAPMDTYVAAGLNGQLLNVVPSEGLVVLRMGDAPTGAFGPVSLTFNNDMWAFLANVIDLTNETEEPVSNQSSFRIFPNPVSNWVYLEGLAGKYLAYDLLGRCVHTFDKQSSDLQFFEWNIHSGIFIIQSPDGRTQTLQVVK